MTPLIDNAQWLERLSGLPPWTMPPGEALIISPHPDDETLGTGGLIWSLRRRGTAVKVIAVTDGEGAYADSPGLSVTRRREQEAALARLGVSPISIVRLGLPDRHLAEHEASIAQAIVASLTPGCHIYAPWQGDFHPDHEACGRAARQVAETRGLGLTSYFFWTWHRGDLETIDALPLRAFTLRKDARQAKREALACHASQLVHKGEEPILPESLLGPVDWPFEIFLDERGQA